MAKLTGFVFPQYVVRPQNIEGRKSRYLVALCVPAIESNNLLAASTGFEQLGSFKLYGGVMKGLLDLGQGLFNGFP